MQRSPRTALTASTLATLALTLLLCGLGLSPQTVIADEEASNRGSGLSPEILRLLDLIEHRARLMPDVARFKWHAQRAITDPDRERAVLAAGTATAAAAGLQADSARSFVAAQMAVSRDIQRHAFDGFTLRPPVPDGPDLVRDLRPAISATTSATLQLIPRVLPLLAGASDTIRADLQSRLAPLGAAEASIRALADAVTSLAPSVAERAAQGRLERILASGRLRVGTTGDYAPFSARAQDGSHQGIDIDLARDLAQRLGVDLEFVATSWPALMADLQAQRFDIAMSGISRTLGRALHADFSAPYHIGGKTPVVRCEHRATLGSLAEIDRTDVRVIVNPGGTNEGFARARLQHAAIAIFDDNTRIFEEIAAGRADVMFTDAIEVARVTRMDPRLCPAMPGTTLTYQEKGILLPRGDHGVWLRYVDLWLAQVRGSGRLAEIFARHGAEPVAP